MADSSHGPRPPDFSIYSLSYSQRSSKWKWTLRNQCYCVRGATPFSLIPSAFMTMGRQHIHECVRAHAQLVDKFQEVNRSWLQYLQSEADLSAELTPKMITARSIPGAATVLLEWTNRRVEMAALDAKHVLADTQEIMEIGLRMLPGGWLFNGKGCGSSISAATAGFPSPASPPSSARPDCSASPTAPFWTCLRASNKRLAWKHQVVV